MADLTKEALEGYEAHPHAKRPYYATSDSGAAWELGRMCRILGWRAPTGVRPSRGYRYHCSGRIALVKWIAGEASITWEGDNA